MSKKAVVGKKRISATTGARTKSGVKTSGQGAAAAKAARKTEPSKSAGMRPPKGPVWQWSAGETAAAIRFGAIAAVEVLDAHLERMRAVNPKLNAVVVDLSEEARKAAMAADNRRSSASAARPWCCRRA